MALRNRGVRVPLLAMPAVILVVLPTLMVLGGGVMAANTPLPAAEAGSVLDRLTEGAVQGELTGYSGPGQWAVFVLEIFLAPLYLLVPLVVATVIAADSFAGERERRTLEALLHTPTSDSDLFVAKLLASWLPALVIGVGGFVVYSVVANVVAWPFVGEVFFPNAVWVALALWVTPAISALGLGAMVAISSRVESLQSAHQVGSLVVLPVLGLVVLQVSGAVVLDLQLVLLVGALLWSVAAFLLLNAARTFTRDRLAARL